MKQGDPHVDNVLQNVASSRAPSATSTKRNSHPALTRRNPWEEEKRASISERRKGSKNNASLPGQFLQLGSCKYPACLCGTMIGRGNGETVWKWGRKMILKPLFLIVRPGLKDFLVKMSTEAQMGLRSFVQRAVVHKVRSLKFMPHEICNVIFNHCRLTMAMRLIGCLS